MIKRLQKLTALSGYDRFIVAWLVLDIVLAPLASLTQFVLELGLASVVGSVFSFTWSFSKAMENKGFDDPVYKKNLQRLIERNRQFEEERNEPHS
jgi:hypothetical protein